MKYNSTEEFLLNIIETEELENNPCSKCDGDCCGSVPFKFEELEVIFKKYSKVPEFKKRFKADSRSSVSKKLLNMIRPHKDDKSIILTFKNKSEYIKNNIEVTSCIFKRDEEVGSNHCMIYEDRPLICRAYGTKTCCCPYAGLEEQPKGFVKLELIQKAHKARQSNMLSKFTGVEL